MEERITVVYELKYKKRSVNNGVCDLRQLVPLLESDVVVNGNARARNAFCFDCTDLPSLA